MSNHDANDQVRRAWHECHLVPLWESPTAHKPPPPPDSGHLWPWTRVRPLLSEAMKVTSPAAVERRVMSLVAPHPRSAEDEATARTLSAAIQMLLPGERARPHRHSMNALRFVLEGHGATTLVDGKACAMEPGDLILTPAWTWHEHVHAGDAPVIWLDVLDVPLHLWLGTVEFQPGPVNDAPQTIADEVFQNANILPETLSYGKSHSPVFRYPYARVTSALEALPDSADGSRRVRYVNPLNGRGALSLMDVTMHQISRGRSTQPFRTNSNAICCVVEGTGTSVVGDQRLTWQEKDVFSMPQGNWICHTATSDVARLLIVSDRDALDRLGLYKEEFAS